MKRRIRVFLVEFLTSTLGNILLILFPEKVHALSEKGMTLVMGDNLSLTERLIRRAIFMKLEKTQDYDTIAKLHKTYWYKQGHDFVNKMQNNLEDIQLPSYKPILNVLKNQIAKEPIKFDKLIEIGTGNGVILDYLSYQLPEIEIMVGIDLNKNQTARNKARYIENTKLDFIAADLLDWVVNQRQANLVFITFRGVLEYFSQKQLIQFFKKLNSLGNIIFFAIEPVDLKHDFRKDPDSKIYGVEGSFSHNYAELFENEGFKIWHFEQKDEGAYSQVMNVIGVKNF